MAVLRLVVSGRSDLDHGEIVTTSGQVAGRFRTWDALLPAVLGWLTYGEPGQGSTPVGEPGADE